MMVLDSVLEIGDFDVSLYNTKVIKMKVSIKTDNTSDWFTKNLIEVREFYITLDVDVNGEVMNDFNPVTNIYDSTSNLHNFGIWDPNKTLLYKQLVNACMVHIIENSYIPSPQ